MSAVHRYRRTTFQAGGTIRTDDREIDNVHVHISGRHDVKPGRAGFLELVNQWNIVAARARPDMGHNIYIYTALPQED